MNPKYNKVELYSFDIFDTLIGRLVCEPKGIWLIMRNILNSDFKYNDLPKYFKENFVQLRIMSEKRARYIYNDVEDITLEIIYNQLSYIGNISNKYINILMMLEKEVEYDNIYPIIDNINRLKEIRKNNNIVLISDMYLDSSFIRHLLCKVDNIFEDIKIYVSSEIKLTKSSGNLYKFVYTHENYPKTWIHYGDNEYSDVNIPKKYGINGILFNRNELLSFEKDMFNIYNNYTLFQIYTGVAKYLRKPDNSAYNVGCSLGGPVLYSYANWIIDECIRLNINRLHFVARDGYILKKIIDNIVKNRFLSIKTTYFYSSRRAWEKTILLYTSNGVSELLNKYKTIIHNLKDISDLLGIDSTETLLKFINKDNTKLSLSQIGYLLDNSKEFKEYIKNKFKNDISFAIAYIKQEIVFSDDRFAFVEIFGSGYTQNILSEIIYSIAHVKVKHFYFSQSYQKNNYNNSIFITFTPIMSFDACVLEALSRACHESTSFYYKENDKIKPQFKGSDGKLLEEYNYNSYIEGAVDFSNITENMIKKYNININVNIIQDLVKIFLNNPSTKECIWLFDMPYDMWHIDGKFGCLVPKMTKQDIRDIFLFRKNDVINKFIGCLQMSILRCNINEKRHIQKYKSNGIKILERFNKIYERK